MAGRPGAEEPRETTGKQHHFLWADKSSCIHAGAQLGNEKVVTVACMGSWLSPPRRNALDAWVQGEKGGHSPALANPRGVSVSSVFWFLF